VETRRPPRAELADLRPYSDKEITADVMLASNENPSNLPNEVSDRLARIVKSGCTFNRYPDPVAGELRTLIAEANGLEPGNVLVGNGGDELIFDLLLAWGGPGRTLLNVPPTFVMYDIDARITGTTLVEVPRTETFDVDEAALMARLGRGDVDVVFIANPNNPTGNIAPETLLIDILNTTDALVLVDEAYFEFSRHTMRPHMQRHPNLVILRTFSKAFCLAGLRVGYLLAHEDVISELTKVRQPYSVDRFSQQVASLVYSERAAFESGIREIVRQRGILSDALSAMPGVTAFPSGANFILFSVEGASAIWRELLDQHSVLIRDFSSAPLLRDCLRVSVGTDAENRRFLDAMTAVLARRGALQGEV
jgi:histidinol-phosphate aminotransferase